MTQFDNTPMIEALRFANEAAAAGEVPIAAVITDAGGGIIASASNRVEGDCDPTAHAEILALRQAARLLGTPRLAECDLWVTLEPCAMCAGAISHARIRRLYYGAHDAKSGGVDNGARVFAHPSCHHKPEVYSGIMEAQASTLLKQFFASRR